MIRRVLLIAIATVCVMATALSGSVTGESTRATAVPPSSTADSITRALTIHAWGNDAAGNPQYDTSVSTSTGESVRKEIAGAQLTLSTADGYIKKDDSSAVDVTISSDGRSATWTSTTTALVLQVAAGSYTLHEDKASDGYYSAADVTFTVPEDTTTVDTSKDWQAISEFPVNADATNPWEYKDVKWTSRQAIATTGDGKRVDPLPSISVADGSGTSSVVYCYNYLSTAPRGPQASSGMQYTRYNETEGSIAMLWTSAAYRLQSDAYGTISDSTEFARRIMSVATRGYPNNATITANNPTDLLAGLDANQQRMVTQLAVWHYTDGGYVNKFAPSYSFANLVDPTTGNYYGFNQAMIDAYKKLIDPTGYTLQASEALQLYQPGSEVKNYQNLLGTATITPKAMEASIVDDSIDYSKNPATATISGTKTINGKTLSQYGTTGDDATVRNLFDTFAFRIASDTNAPLPDSDTATVGADGTFTFGRITYTQPGTYVYSVAEIPGTDPDVGYDSTAHTVTVQVTKGTGADVGKLVSTVTYADTGGITVNNVYTKDATAQLEVTKTIDGKTPARNAYDFTVTANNGAPMPEGTPAGGSAIITNDSLGKAILSPIVFSKAGTYTYAITENKPADADAGISYDTGTVTATVTVTRNDAANELEASVSYSKDAADGTVTTGQGGNAFQNTTIAPNPVDVSIGANKTLDGKTGFAPDTFFFTLQANAPDTPMSADPADNGSELTVSAHSDGTIPFGTIRYTAEGTYTYTMTESKGDDAGIAYDSSVVLVTVTVTRDTTTNDLQASVTYSANGSTSSDKPTFRNTTIAPGAVKDHIYSSKTLAGKPAASGQFSFRLNAADGTPMPESCTPQTDQTTGTIYCDTNNGENGVIDFGPIVYSAEGTYTYAITENATGDPSIAKDTASHVVTVTVTRDPATNTLSDTVTYDAGKAPAGFSNSYVKAVPTTAQLRLTKMLDGIPANKAGQFSFELHPVSTDAIDTEGNAVSVPMPADATTGSDGTPTATTTNQGAGHASWTDITFEYPGVYTYAIHEMAGSDANIVYDANVYTARVTVTRNDDNTLSASVSYAGTDALLVVQNTTTTGWVEIRATKLLDGKPAKAGQFTFSITPSGNAPRLLNTTISNGDNGLIDFTVPITLKDLGDADSATFTYTFREVQGDDPTIEYDTKDRTATVYVKKVVKDGVTGLRAMVVIDKEQATADDKNKDYIAYGWDGVADGTIYHAKAGATITVDDFDDASDFDLVATPDQGDAYIKHYPKIHNTTKPLEPATADLTATKTLDGTAPTGGAFTFTLTAADGTPMPEGATQSTAADGTAQLVSTASNGADGTVDFGTITYTAEGVYRYSIAESVPSDADVQSGTTVYDTSTHAVTVTVARSTADPNKLVASMIYDTSTAPAFANTTVPTTAVPVTKSMTGSWPDGARYSFTMTALGSDDGGSADGAGPLPAASATTGDAGDSVTLTIGATDDAAGGKDGADSKDGAVTASFGSFPFTVADMGKTYVYEVRENGADGQPGTGGVDANAVAYSRAVYRVQVTVGEGMADATQRLNGNRAGVVITQIVDENGQTLDTPVTVYDSSQTGDGAGDGGDGSSGSGGAASTQTYAVPFTNTHLTTVTLPGAGGPGMGAFVGGCVLAGLLLLFLGGFMVRRDSDDSDDTATGSAPRGDAMPRHAS